MKFLVAALIAAGLSSSCGVAFEEKSSSEPASASASASASRGQVGVPETASFLASLKTGASANACAAQIKSILGVSVTQVLPAIGVIAFNAIPEQAQQVAKLRCVAAVEKDGEVGALGRDRSSGARLGYLSTVNVQGDVAAATRRCANAIRGIAGTEIVDVLTEIGAITFVGTAELSKKVAKLSCIASVERDESVHALPSTRIGN